MLKSILTIASGGIMLGLLGATSIPTEMKPPEEQPWQKHLRKQYEQVAAAPLYDAPPEDLSPRAWTTRPEFVSDARYFEPADVAYVEVSFTHHEEQPAPPMYEAEPTGDPGSAAFPMTSASREVPAPPDAPHPDRAERAAAAAAAAAWDVSAALDRAENRDRS